PRPAGPAARLRPGDRRARLRLVLPPAPPRGLDGAPGPRRLLAAGGRGPAVLRDRGLRLLPPDGALTRRHHGRDGTGQETPRRDGRDHPGPRPRCRRPARPTPRPLPVGGPLLVDDGLGEVEERHLAVHQRHVLGHHRVVAHGLLVLAGLGVGREVGGAGEVAAVVPGVDAADEIGPNLLELTLVLLRPGPELRRVLGLALHHLHETGVVRAPIEQDLDVARLLEGRLAVE